MTEHKVQVTSTLELSHLADEMVFQTDATVLQDFILELDAGVGEVDWTQSLIARLNGTLDEEDRVPTNKGIEIAEAMRQVRAAVFALDHLVEGQEIDGVHTGDSAGFPEASS